MLGENLFADPIALSCQAIIGGHTAQIDTMRCNGKLSLLLVGLGYETDMISYADRQEKDNAGVVAYLKGFANALADNTPFEATISVDDNAPQTITTVSIVVANAAPSFSVLAQGGGKPDVSDGLLDLTWIKHVDSPITNLSTMLELFRANPDRMGDYIAHQQVHSLKIETSQPMPYVIDGEVLESTPIEIECCPSSLKVMVLEQAVNGG